jgi:hypothetical protein
MSARLKLEIGTGCCKKQRSIENQNRPTDIILLIYIIIILEQKIFRRTSIKSMQFFSYKAALRQNTETNNY